MSVLAFPAVKDFPGGTIHVMAHADGGFEIGHESRSGNSWGYFEQFDKPEAAIAAAHALNRRIGNDCGVHICTAALAHIKTGGRYAPGDF